MTKFRRYALLAVAAGLSTAAASADTITYGVDPSTGNLTITQTATLTATTLNVASPTALFSFQSFNSLIAGGALGATAQYVSPDSSFDLQFTNSVTNFSVTNNDTSTDTVSASVNSLINVDPGTNMPNANGSGDRKNASGDLGFGFTGNTPNQQNIATASTPAGGVTLTNGQTYTYSPLPATYTDGVSYNFLNSNTAAACTFGDTNLSDACALQLFSNSYVNTDFTYGLTDTQQFGENLVGSGILNLNIQATSTLTAVAEVTYEYTVPSPTNPTPEPASIALFGGALVGIGLLRKRTRNS
jgi:hypothetical protein